VEVLLLIVALFTCFVAILACVVAILACLLAIPGAILAVIELRKRWRANRKPQDTPDGG